MICSSKKLGNKGILRKEGMNSLNKKYEVMLKLGIEQRKR